MANQVESCSVQVLGLHLIITTILARVKASPTMDGCVLVTLQL